MMYQISFEMLEDLVYNYLKVLTLPEEQLRFSIFILHISIIYLDYDINTQLCKAPKLARWSRVWGAEQILFT